MSKLTVETQRRGPTLRLTLLVMVDNFIHSKEMVTETIDVGMAQIIGKLIFQRDKENKYGLTCRIRIKKSDYAKTSTVLTSIRHEATNFDKQISCSNEWIEVLIFQYMGYNSVLTDGYLYVNVVDISVHATMPAISVVNNLLYEDTEFTDFQLHTTDGTVAVHKAMLAIHGDMFKTMLRGDWKETNEGSININGVTAQTLQDLKKYMYLGTLPDEDEGVESLLLISHPYLMKKLEEDCINKLIKALKPEKFDDLVEFACQNNIPKLVKALVLSIPDEIVNSVYQLKIEEEKSNNTK